MCSLILGEAQITDYKNLDKIIFTGEEKELFEAIQYSVKTKNRVDSEVVVAKAPHLQETLFEIIDLGVGLENVQEFINSVYRTQLKTRFKTIVSKKLEGNFEKEVLEISKKLEDLVKETVDETDYSRTGHELFVEMLEEMDAEVTEKDLLLTGYTHVDQMINLSHGNMWIIAARPSMGKTVFMVNLAKGFAKRGKKVKIISLEMSSISLQKRVVSSTIAVEADKLATKKGMLRLTKEEKERVCEVFVKAPYILENLMYYDKPGSDVVDVETQFKLAKSQGCEIVMIDYAQYINGDRDYDSEIRKIAEITKRVKNAARENNMLAVVLAQLNRQCELRADRRPIMSDLEGSGELEKTADIISFLYRDEYYNTESDQKGLVELITKKQREGSVGTVNLKFYPQIQRFTDYTGA